MKINNILEHPKYISTIALLITIISLIILFNFINILNKSQDSKHLTGKIIQSTDKINIINKGEIIFYIFILTKIFIIIFITTKLYINLKES